MTIKSWDKMWNEIPVNIMLFLFFQQGKQVTTQKSKSKYFNICRGFAGHSECL